MILLIVLGALCLAGAAYLVGEAVTLPARERRTSVRRAATYGKVRAVLGVRQLPFRQRVLAPRGARLAGGTLKLPPRPTVDGVSARLLAAGLGRKIAPTTFLAFKSALALGGVLLGAVFGGALTGPGGVLLFAIALGGVRFIAPGLRLSCRAPPPQDRLPPEPPPPPGLMAGPGEGRGGLARARP